MNHDYQYVREHCKTDEKICTNCGIFMSRPFQSTVGRHLRGPAIPEPECPGPPRKLKPGVRPQWRGSPLPPKVGRIVGRKPAVVAPTSESVSPSKPVVVPPKSNVNQPGTRNVNVGSNNTGIILVGDNVTIETGDKFPRCDE